MNPFAAIGMSLLAVLLCLASPAHAQETNGTNPAELAVPNSTDNAGGETDPSTISISDSAEREGRILSSDQVELELKLADPEPLSPDAINWLDKLRLTRTDYPALSPEMIRRLRDFRRQRERYLREQERLIKEFKGATDAERQRIREMLRERRMEWLERSRNLPDDARNRLREMVRTMPQYREALEAAREEAENQILDTVRRPRGNR